MQEKGSSTKEVLAQLKNYQTLNNRYKDGHILSSMCTKPHPIAKRAFELFFESNLGDKCLFPGTAQLEKEAISQLSNLLGCNSNLGAIVSGGTEANLLALLAAKNLAKIENPEIILPDSAHFSFAKLCNLSNIKPVYAPLDSNFRVNPDKVEALITKKTIALVGTAGTTELGVVDPISCLSKISLKYHIHLHVDAAFGGLIIPFLSNFETKFDFALEGVSSITVDPHKMGLAQIPAGGVLFKSQSMIEAIKIEVPYLDTCNYTFLGTRSGGSVASVWAIFKVLGKEGFEKIVTHCISNTNYITKELELAGLKIICKPTLNIVGFQGENTKDLAHLLRKRGWFISYIPRYDCIRLVLMPHIRRKHAALFLHDVKEILH